MQKIKPDILKKAFEIGFNFKKQPYVDRVEVVLPCSITLDNGEMFEMAELVMIDKLFKPELFKIVDLERIEKIDESKYALDKKIRKESLNVQEYRGDFPFFIRTINKHVLGFNAYSAVNFTYRENILGNEIIETIPFDIIAEQKSFKSFEFINNHDEIPIQVICGYDTDVIKEIEANNHN